MSPARWVDLASVPVQPWRNGGGTTRELLAGTDANNGCWRISVADIAADGPFSSFPGVERWFAVLSGAGVELTVGGVAHRLRAGDAPLRFDGGAATTCRLLDGPTRDLNLMLRGASGGMHAARHARVWRPGSSGCGLLAAVAGQCHHSKRVIAVPAGTLLWLDNAPAMLRFEADTPPSAANKAPIGWWLAVTPQVAPP